MTNISNEKLSVGQVLSSTDPARDGQDYKIRIEEINPNEVTQVTEVIVTILVDGFEEYTDEVLTKTHILENFRTEQ